MGIWGSAQLVPKAVGKIRAPRKWALPEMSKRAPARVQSRRLSWTAAMREATQGTGCLESQSQKLFQEGEKTTLTLSIHPAGGMDVDQEAWRGSG